MIVKRDSRMLYYIAIAVYFFFSTLSYSMLGQYEVMHFIIKCIRYFCTLIILLKIVMERRLDSKVFFALMFGVVFSVVIAFIMGSGLPFVLTVLVLGAGKCTGKTIAKIHLGATGLVVGISTILALVGVIEDRLFLRADSEIVRHSLGMTYTTIWAAFVFFLFLSYIYIKNDKVQWYDYVLLILIMWSINYYTSTRLEVGMLILLCLGLLLYKWIERLSIVKAIMIFAFPFFALFVFCLQFMYLKNPLKYTFLDSWLSGRLSCTAEVMNEFKINMFGNFIEMQGHGAVEFDEKIGYFFVDSFYIQYVLRYGLIFMVAMCIFFSFIFWQLYIQDKKRLLFYMLFVCAHGVIISLIMLPQVCPFFIIAFAEYSNERELEVKLINE